MWVLPGWWPPSPSCKFSLSSESPWQWSTPCRWGAAEKAEIFLTKNVKNFTLYIGKLWYQSFDYEVNVFRTRITDLEKSKYELLIYPLNARRCPALRQKGHNMHMGDVGNWDKANIIFLEKEVKNPSPRFHSQVQLPPIPSLPSRVIDLMLRGKVCKYYGTLV